MEQDSEQLVGKPITQPTETPHAQQALRPVETASSVEFLKSNLPVISVSLLIIGTVNLMMYYDYFDIDITSYLDFAEVLQIQFRFFASAAALVVVQVLYTSFLHKVLDHDHEHPGEKAYKERVKAGIPEEIRENIKADKPKKRSKYRNSIILIGTMAACLVINSLPKLSDEAIINWWYVSIPAFIAVVVTAYFGMKDRDATYNTDATFLESTNTIYLQLGLAIILIYISGVIAHTSAMRALLSKSSSEVTIVMDKQTISTNESYRFIGKTKNYIFFYNIKKQQADIYPNADIKNMSVRKGVDYHPVPVHTYVLFDYKEVLRWFKNHF